MPKARHAVVREARELLLIMEQTLAQVATDGGSSEAVNELFRVVHTIKGSAALFSYDRLAGFAHLMENTLDRVREQRLALTPALQALLLDCSDYIAELVDAVAANREAQEPDAPKREKLEKALAEVSAGGETAAAIAPARAETAGTQDLRRDAGQNDAHHAGGRHWRIALRFNTEILRSGMDPAEFLRVLASLGTVLDVRTHIDELPSAAEFDPECCYLTFSLLLQAECEQADIESVFDFVRDESDIAIQLLDAPAAPQEAPVPPIVEPYKPSRNARHESMQAHVKVPVDRLDTLIDLVGELVLAGASATQVARREQSTAFHEAAQAIEVLVGQIRSATLNLRMIPIGEIFQRFPRVVRGVARQLGKTVQLSMTGSETELDKSMLEQLSEPLMHILRNAIDHGLETPEERRAAGKPPAGELRLAAYHDAGSMVIEVSDDGRGLDYESIRRKAMERGRPGADEQLSDDEAARLLFEPGFSTRARATRLSGRGVGMDVVRQRVETLRGEVEIVSPAGQGTLVRLRLPLTLAIIDGFLVRVGDSHFVIPMDMMVECIDLRQCEARDGVIDVRGESLPYLRLRDVFGLPAATGGRESLVVVQYGRKQRAALVVDWLAGEFQAVIKPLGMLFEKVGGLSGSTILGDGRVALILDIPQLIQRAAVGHTRTACGVDAASSGQG